MAIKLTVQTASGITVTDAVHRVKCITLQSTELMAFLVRSYATIEAQEPFEEKAFECGYDVAGANPWAQAYAHLQGLPAFAGAVAV